MKNYFKTLVVILILIAAVIFIYPETAQADMGPKPAITIIVKNPPDGEYYLDLLIKEDSSHDNLMDERDYYDQQKLELLESYDEDSWYAGLTHGTRVPMFGELTGVLDGSDMVHHFSYVGVPEDFKIIIISPENQIVVSNEIHRNTFQATITYDYLTGKVRQESLPVSYLKQFLITCSATLIIEGLVLLLFGFSLKKNWKAFLVINLITQVLLTATMGTALLKQGMLAAYLVLILIEIVIFIIEAIAFARVLKEHSKRRRVLYALTANLLSFAFGWVMLWFDFLSLI